MPDPAELREEWTRDALALRECRALQKQAAEIGLDYPILDLLVARGRLGRDVARRGVLPDYRFPGDPCTRLPETRVLARLRAEKVVGDEAWRAVEAALRGLAKLKIPATTVGLLLKLGHVRPADVARIERELDEADHAAQAKQEKA